MEGNVPVPGWNAHRRPQEALRPPSYLMKDVPKCSKDLKGSVLYEIQDRNHFKEAMAEMVLLCTEAMRRTSTTRCSSKPLSLEYIADRLDIDDPSFGYIVRTQEGMLQGFITATTFTNWQKDFRWDSLHELAFYYDDSDSEDDDNVPHRPKRERRVDREGVLAKELQQTVRLGDPYNEGIIWPRIAEISLLGALGCGRTLVQLVIEQLEFQKASGAANYDYVALQATDNSISFYESLGFVRVGAVTVQPPLTKTQPQNAENPGSTDSECSAATAEPLPPSSPEKADILALPYDAVSSPLTNYEVKRPGETPSQIAKKLQLNVWDILFLNKDIYFDLAPSARLRKGTILLVPLKVSQPDSKNTSPTKWFVAKENDTPRKIAKKFSLPCKKLVEANLNRLPELQPNSRLKAGTRMKISNLDQHDDLCDPYCHWSFPDDTTVEGGEPSYMMVYKLDRKTARHPRQVRNSLAVPIKPYSPAPLLLPAPQTQKTVTVNPDPPKPPQEPKLGVDIFKEHIRQLYPELCAKTKENEAELDGRWYKLSQAKKDRYNTVAMETRKHYDKVYEQYQAEYNDWKREFESSKHAAVPEKDTTLFNKVVKLREDAPEGHDYSYWFVLTYIPDLKWCHLAPMIQDGIFGPERKRSHGRPKWRLVDEKLGKELDLSSMYCIPVRSKAVKKTVDADKEEWDILDGTPMDYASTDMKSFDALHEAGNAKPRRTIRKQPLRARSAIKPLGGKLTVVKPMNTTVLSISPTATDTSVLHSQSSQQSIEPCGHPQMSTPEKRDRSTPPRVSPRWTPKESEKGPARKARRISNAGARRCALQL